MKAYQLTVLVIDFEGMGGEDIKVTLENQRYPNWCISPNVLDVKEADIGEWSDDHPLNYRDTMREHAEQLFKTSSEGGD